MTTTPATPQADPAGPPPDPNTIFCHRAPSWTSPCAVRDGKASAHSGVCDTCLGNTADLLQDLVPKYVVLASGVRDLYNTLPRT